MSFSGVEPSRVSVIIPTFNGARRIVDCLDALRRQATETNFEILVVDDGSTDDTAEVVRQFSGVHLLSQPNSGPAAARNYGAVEAKGELILFTDDDCVPAADWLDAMLEPFVDPEIVGVKGAYRTLQKNIAARFVQIEYEDRYRFMSRFQYVDFVDTYSAAFRRTQFLAIGGYDIAFPLACAEDVDLSYRMSRRHWKLKFSPGAIVYHTHPNSLIKYLKKKYKFAFWRVLAVRRNPGKGFKDSHTPQLMKLQMLFVPALVLGVALDYKVRPVVPAFVIVIACFLISTLPFSWRAASKDFIVGMFSPFLLMARSFAQLLGVTAGLFHASRGHTRVVTKWTV